MNTLRLVLGWLFLAGFTAAGTYYAMDEVDQRVGLARFQLHEKLGVIRYTQLPTPPVQVIPQPPVQVNPNPPIQNNPNPPVQVNPNPPVQVNPNPPVQVNPNPPIQNNPNPPVHTTPNPPIQNNPNPQPPIRTNPNPPIQTNPNPPIQNNPNPPIQNNPNPPIQNNPQPPVNRPPSRPADFVETNSRLVQLQGDYTRLRSTVSRMNTPYGTARLDGPLHSLEGFLRLAQQSLNQNDTGSARRYMDQADGQVAKLKELLDQ